MKNIHKLLNIICLSCLLAITILFLAGCGFAEDPPETNFIISGKFTKSGAAGSGDVIFKIANKGSYTRSPAPQRVITNDSYAISGELQDGALTINLKGSYNPYDLTYTVSADKSGNSLRYVINGAFYYDGAFRKAAATLLKKDDSTLFRFPVTAQHSVPITGAAVDSDENGIPDFALGLWRGGSGGFGAGNSLEYVISPFSYIIEETITHYDDDYPEYYKFYRTIVKVIDNSSYYDFITAYDDSGGTRYEKCKIEFSDGNTRMSIRNYLNGKSLEFTSAAAAEAATSLASYSSALYR